jgi:hypothetical protein
MEHTGIVGVWAWVLVGVGAGTFYVLMLWIARAVEDRRHRDGHDPEIRVNSLLTGGPVGPAAFKGVDEAAAARRRERDGPDR